MDLCMSVAAQLMLREIEKGSSSKNVVLSPMSIEIVLNMLASGSQGETLDQFLRFLGAKNVEELSANARAMMSLLASAQEDDARPDAPPSDPLHLGKRQWQPLREEPFLPMANPLWVDRGYPLRPRFAGGSAEEYGARPAAPLSVPLSIGKRQRLPYAAEGDQRLREEPFFPMANPLGVDRTGYPLRPRFAGGSAEEYGARPAASPSVPLGIGQRRWLDDNETSPFAAEREQRRIVEPVFPMANPPWVDHRYPLRPRFAEMPLLASAGFFGPSVPRFFSQSLWQVEDSQTWSFPAEREQRLREGPVFSMANALWIDYRYPLKSRFAEIADTVYKALVKNVDLVTEAEKVKKEVNLWAEKETKGLIKEVLSPDIKLAPPLCLANALYFEATWQSPFSASDTLHGRNFYLLKGETATVSYMTTQNEREIFGSFKDFKILNLPYKRGQCSAESPRFSMYVFLPHARDGLRDLAAKLDADPASLHPKNFPLQSEPLSHVCMPKLKFTFDFEAQDLMAAKKLTLPFDREHADFSNMVENPENVYVGKIIHKAFIEVAEKGTKAAAVTVACMGYGCGPGMVERPKQSFVADHPFMFMIVEDSSELVVFAGAVLNPA